MDTCAYLIFLTYTLIIIYLIRFRDSGHWRKYLKSWPVLKWKWIQVLCHPTFICTFLYFCELLDWTVESCLSLFNNCMSFVLVVVCHRGCVYARYWAKKIIYVYCCIFMDIAVVFMNLMDAKRSSHCCTTVANGDIIKKWINRNQVCRF